MGNEEIVLQVARYNTVRRGQKEVSLEMDGRYYTRPVNMGESLVVGGNFNRDVEYRGVAATVNSKEDDLHSAVLPQCAAEGIRKKGAKMEQEPEPLALWKRKFTEDTVHTTNQQTNKQTAYAGHQPIRVYGNYSLRENHPSTIKQNHGQTTNQQQHHLDVNVHEITSSPKKIRSDPQATEERHFYSLYMEVLDAIMAKNKISEEMVSSGIDDIVESFHYDLGRKFSDVDLTKYENVCGYLFRLGMQSAGLVRYRVLEAVENCAGLRDIYLKQRTPLNVVSLGGGPGNDAVGFCSALHDSAFLHGRFLNITVVDAVRQWSECVDQVSRLLRQKDFGNVSAMFRRNMVTMDFAHAKLPIRPRENRFCYETLVNADIVLVTRLLSSLDWNEKTEVIQNIHQVISDQAVVLYIDSPFHLHLWVSEGFDVLYDSWPEDQYQISEQHQRFGHRDSPQSTARIAVLIKAFPDDPGDYTKCVC